jgi:uncharacterized protein (TIGR02145 family)
MRFILSHFSLIFLILILSFRCQKDVDISQLGIAPDMPTLSSPANSTADIVVPLIFVWNSANEADNYTLQVSTDSLFENIAYEKKGLTATYHRMSSLIFSTKYYWHVNAVNKFGISAWSQVWNFTTASLPSIPILFSPADNETNVLSSPVLIWNNSSGAVSYTLQVAMDNLFTKLVYNQSGITDTSQNITGLNHSTIYYWRVSAKNKYGSSSWSLAWQFTTGSPPSVPLLSSPVNNADDIYLPPTLTWNASDGALTYTLQVSIDNAFTSIAYDESSLTSTGQQINGLENATKYFWRVNAKNVHGVSNWSDVWNFTISQACPGLASVTYASKLYHTVMIGNQCWLKENLEVGVMIDSLQNQSDNRIIEKYCYSNKLTNCNIYGGLYQWNEAMQYSTIAGNQGICPPGWHVPTQEEFLTLRTAVELNGNALKAIGQGSGDGAGTNMSGFSALLAGVRNDGGYYSQLYYYARFWVSDKYTNLAAWYLNLSSVSNFIEMNFTNYGCGLSIRCIKDQHFF